MQQKLYFLGCVCARKVGSLQQKDCVALIPKVCLSLVPPALKTHTHYDIMSRVCNERSSYFSSCSTLITHSKEKKRPFHVFFFHVTQTGLEWSTPVCAPACVCVILLTTLCGLVISTTSNCYMVRTEREAREANPHNLWSDKRREDDRDLKISPTTAGPLAGSQYFSSQLKDWTLLCHVRFSSLVTCKWTHASCSGI